MASLKRIDREVVRHMTVLRAPAGEIARELDCSKRTVVRIRRELGIGAQRESGYSNVLSPDRAARVAAMVEDGASIAEISRTLGVGRETVRRRFPTAAWTQEQIHEQIRLNREFREWEHRAGNALGLSHARAAA